MEIRSRMARLAIRRPFQSHPDVAATRADTVPIAEPLRARPASLHGGPRDRVRRRDLDRAMTEVTAALLLASTGRVTRVVVCDLRQGETAARALRGVASELGVEVRAVSRAEGGGTDVSATPR